MLDLDVLRTANALRLPLFKDSHGHLAHSKTDGSDWSPAQWLQAVIGELGEYANVRKKYERGDLSHEQYSVLAAKELADVLTYFSILCMRALDEIDACGLTIANPFGVDISKATIEKFNEVSKRVGADVWLTDDGRILQSPMAK